MISETPLQPLVAAKGSSVPLVIPNRSKKCTEIALSLFKTQHMSLYLHSYAGIWSTQSAVLVATRRSLVMAINCARCECLWRLRFIRRAGQGGWGGRPPVSYGCAHYCQFNQPQTVPAEQAHFSGSELASMKQENRFLSITVPLQCTFCMSLPSPHASDPLQQGVRTIKSNSVFSMESFIAKVFPIGIRNGLEYWRVVSFLSIVWVCTRVHVCKLNSGSLLGHISMSQ